MRRRAVVLLLATLTMGALVVGPVGDAGASVSSAKKAFCKGKTKKKAIKQIEDAYDHFLNGADFPDAATDKAPRIQYLSDPDFSQDLYDRFLESSEANAEQAATTGVQVNEVSCTGKKTAEVDFDLVINGEPLADLAPLGSAILQGKTWKVTGTTLCDLQQLGDATVAEPPHPCADILLGDDPADAGEAEAPEV